MWKRYQKMTAFTLMIAFMLELVLACVPYAAAAADEYDSLRDKWKTMLTGGAVSVSDPDIAAQIGKLTATAQQYWSTMNTSTARTYLWSDLDDAAATNDLDKSSNISLTYRRLEAMALAYATSGSSLYHSAALLADTIGGLDWMNANKYNSGKVKVGNWFDWEISTPLTLNNSTVLLYDELTSSQISAYMSAVDYFNPTVTMTGANRVWESTVIGVRGVIVKDTAKLTAARNGLTNVFAYVTSGDGFYKDGSFIQHGKYAYTGGYGESLLTNLANVLYLLNGSTWQVTNAGLANVFQWVYDSFEPLMYQGAMMDMSRGRAISRRADQDHAIGSRIVKAVVQLAQIAPAADALRFKSIVKHWVQTDTFYPFYANAGSVYHIALVKAIMSDSAVVPSGESASFRLFAAMDRAVQRRTAYGFALSMSSSRIYNYESINDENLKGWYTGDGMTYVYSSDLGQYSDDYWALVNKYRLPGTTVDTRTRTNKSGAAYLSGSNWTGGTAIGPGYGAAGMELDAYGSTLAAKKSWFMLADKVVALGAGISSTDNRTIETTVENRKLNAAGSNALTVNGTAKSASLGWSETMTGVNRIHMQGSTPGSDIGYYFPGGAAVKGLREARTGTWESMNTYAKTKDSTVLTRNFMTLWLDHGTNPTAGAYAYVIVPNVTSSQLDAYAANPDIAILENSADAQAAKDKSVQATGINFWTNVSKTVYDSGAPFVTSSTKASVMTLETPGGLEVAVADPTQTNAGTVELEINRSAGSVVSADTGVTVTQLQPVIKLTVNVSGAKGKTFNIKFDYSPPGSVLVDENFDAMTAGSVPAGWTLDQSGGTAVVVNDPSATNKSLRLTDTSTVSPVVAKKTFASAAAAVTAEFDIKPGAESLYAVQLMSGTTAAVRIRTGSGKLQVSNGGTYADLQSYTASSWYTIKIVANPATDKADVYVNGVLRQSQGSFASAVSAIDAIQFATHSTTGSMTMQVDNVKVNR